MILEEVKKKLCEKENGSVTVVNRGITPLSLLGIAFIIMKVMGYITWSWWWVLAPFWIPAVIAVTLVLIVIGMIVIVAYQEQKLAAKISSEIKTTRTKKTKKSNGESAKGKNEQGS